MGQRRLHGLLCLCVAAFILTATAGSILSAFDTRPPYQPDKMIASPSYVWREILLAPLNHPAAPSAYASVLFNLIAASCLAAGLWLTLSQVTFEFGPNAVTRTVTLWRKHWRQTLSNGHIELTASYSDQGDREGSVWQWGIDLRHGDSLWRRLFADRSGRSVCRGREMARELARIAQWKVTEEFYWADRPQPSDSTGS